MHLEKVTGKNVIIEPMKKAEPFLFQNILFLYWPIFIIFWNCTLKCNKNCFTDSENCETTKYIKLNKGKWESRNETRKNYETKRNFTFDETKWNEMKWNEISLFILFRETSEISRNNFLFRFVSCLAKQKKRMRNGNPNTDTPILF
jgi:hypothetical protein